MAILDKNSLDAKLAVAPAADRSFGRRIAIAMAEVSTDIISRAHAACRLEDTAASIRDLGNQREICEAAAVATDGFNRLDDIVAAPGCSIGADIINAGAIHLSQRIEL